MGYARYGSGCRPPLSSAKAVYGRFLGMSRLHINSLIPKTFLLLLTILSIAACGGDVISDPAAYGTTTSTLRPGSYGRILETENQIHKVTIIQVTDDVRSAEMTPEPPEGQKYWTAKIMLENVGHDAITPGQVKLRTADGVDFNPITVTGLTSPFPIPSLGRDAKSTATFVFEIPRDVPARSLSYLPDASKKEAIVFTV
jgi:hypothetical protein